MDSEPLIHNYRFLWNRLKQQGTVSIVANRVFHKRIIKAIIKKKYEDVGYKIEIEPKFAFLTHERKGQMITFHLKVKYHIDLRMRGEITSEDI